MPPPIAALADKYLYDPIMVKVKAATLTIDTVEQFYVETSQRDKNETLARVLEAERPIRRIVFVPHQDRHRPALPHTARKGIRVKALHGDMTQGRRDGVMISFKDGRVPISSLRRRRARARHLRGDPRLQLRPLAGHLRASHRPHRSRGPLGPRDHLHRPQAERDLKAIEAHAKTEIVEWEEGAKVPRTSRPPTERSPLATRSSRTTRRSRVANGAYRVADRRLRAGPTASRRATSFAAVHKTGLDGERIRNVRGFVEHFALLEVPADDAERVVAGGERRQRPASRGRPGVSLDAFVGEWEIRTSYTEVPPGKGDVRVDARRSVPAVPLGDRAAVPERPHAHDARPPVLLRLAGVHRVYEMSFDGTTWTLFRDHPDPFPQRFTGTFSEDGDHIDGRWEKQDPDWQTDFTGAYTRIS